MSLFLVYSIHSLTLTLISVNGSFTKSLVIITGFHHVFVIAFIKPMHLYRTWTTAIGGFKAAKDIEQTFWGTGIKVIKPDMNFGIRCGWFWIRIEPFKNRFVKFQWIFRNGFSFNLQSSCSRVKSNWWCFNALFNNEGSMWWIFSVLLPETEKRNGYQIRGRNRNPVSGRIFHPAISIKA